MSVHYQGASPISAPLLLEWWKPVVGYQGYYEVSNVGNVRRAKLVARAPSVRILKPRPNEHGYGIVNLCRDGKSQNARVHILVALSFIGPCPDGHEVNHIDTVKSRNRLSNLEYVTRSGNMNHINAYSKLVKGKATCGTKLTRESVLEIREQCKRMSQREVGELHGVTKSNISAIINGKSWAWI